MRILRFPRIRLNERGIEMRSEKSGIRVGVEDFKLVLGTTKGSEAGLERARRH